MTEVHYYRRWGFRGGKGVDPYTVEQARQIDAEGEPIAVVLGPLDAPDAVLEITRSEDFARVFFVDKYGRRQASYTFLQVDADRMFLEEVTVWDYPDVPDSDEPNSIESTVIAQDGTSVETTEDFVAGEIITRQYRDIPLTDYWEPVPAFGEWDSIARKARDQRV